MKEIKAYTELKEKLLSYLTKEDLESIDKAYQYAYEKHAGQLRRTGEDYINHPIAVAEILTTIKADTETICAAFLHDVLEDTETTKEELKELYGDVVANLVDGVTKINDIKISTENEYLTNYYKKIIVGMSEDVRVIIIKLADRLHNMRTLYAIPLDRQKAKSKETLEILAPIAHRLGMHKIKTELEDLCLKYLKPEVYFDIVETLNNTKIERESYINKMMSEVGQLLKQNNIKYEIKGRAKGIYSIYKKLDKGRSFSDIYDLLAIRILVDKEQDCYLALGIIHSKYKPVAKRFKDFIAMPKTNLYQTLHTTVFGVNSYLFEIQIRTHEMDEIAENGIASHWAYKEHKNAANEMQNITEQKLQFYKSIIELNEEKMNAEDFVNSVKNEVLSNNIYVYTPKGDVIELIIGATPIDFAYKVHSQVGDKMTGALVNDQMVPLSHKLNNFDIVKIITNNNSKGPSREWINIAKTTQAKNKIKAFFNKTSKEDFVEAGKVLLEKELRKRKIPIADFMKDENLSKIYEDFKFKDLEELHYSIGANKFTVKSVVKHNLEETSPQEEKKAVRILPKNRENDIIVGSTKNIKTHIAECCKPIPGDEIVGYITKNTGISIHRKNCQNINHEDERIVSTSWNDSISNRYTAAIILYTNSNLNIVLDIVQAASNCNIPVENVSTINKGDNSVYSLNAVINNKEELNKLMKNLNAIKSVTDVERIMK